ncbi:WD40 repeat-like protein [Fomitiporia mediterranea MF3/22]|uniref:WD40 repeat-like protein n=1 Tax=Fomitiporia mediterranea (strain MF3/22) TaxID=694068 RepID=UPI00044097BA|nr:WD40 repeat-like protein [Fomitiporia mediterranea MF3/22]EJC99689.1 WD40 repeat-like protein [Fomitiporia mediterranea MF3/22]
MHTQLKFNICGLESSHLANHSVTDISARVKKNVSETLTHSSVHWIEHISQADNAQTFNTIVVELLCSPKALFWIEILSLLGLLEKGKEIKLAVRTWSRSFALQPNCTISSLPSKMRLLPAHPTYTSPPWHGSRQDPLVYKNRFGGIVPSREADISFLKGERSSIFSARYTSDDSKIISRSYDERLQIWEAQNGLAICKDFESRMSGINAIAYSPDGSKIVIACSDEKPRIWDVQTGALLVEPRSGHERRSWIWDVAYSPDGTRVVSASTDKTLRIWDAQNGVCVGELQGHTDAVHAVVYAPDGKRIVSSSGDGTLRIWNAENGVPMGGPLKGHKGWIWGIAYSPDGNRIVSDSFANTLQIWDAHDGKSITARGEPRNGYGDTVGTLVYSPDGSRIVSGCENGTLRFWDVQSGKPNGQSPKGHESRVNAVAFSPDGSRIASGSEDKTVRIWDSQSGEPIGEPITGHEEQIVAVEYSPDGNRIASGSWDGTIRIWDGCDGSLVNLTIFDDRCYPLRRIEQTVNPLRMSADGWIRTLDDGLFLWVPPEHRTSLCTKGQVRVLDDRGRRFMKLNWGKICHGKDWAKVYLDSTDKP